MGILKRLRGWGGVATMAGACVVTASLTLLPLSQGGGAGSADGPGPGPGAAHAAQAAACDEESAVQSLRPSGKNGPTIEEIENREKNPGKLIVGIDQNSYRWGYRNADSGELEGFDIDLARTIAEDILGSRDDVIFRAVPTDRRIPAITGGEVDMVVRTMTISCSRIEQGVAFSTAYFKAGQQLVVPKGSDIKGYDATMSGRKICSATGSTALKELQRQAYGADITTTVPNQLDCLVKLQLGEVDAVVTDNALAAGQAAQDPMVELAGKPFTTEYYGVAMDGDATDLVRRVNRVLEEYRDDGWQQAYDKWLREDLGGGDSASPPEPRYRDE